MRRLIALTATAAAVLAAPTAAEAAPRIDSYSVRDNGPRIVHTINWCTGYVRPGYDYRTRWNTRVEREDGSDRRNGYSNGWDSRGCYVTRLSRPDYLRYRGEYWGRTRLQFNGFTIMTPWRTFYSS